MSLLERDSVVRVRRALVAGGFDDNVQELGESAASAADAARALKVPPGAIVKSLLFMVDETPVLALVAGDKRARESEIPKILHMRGEITFPDADIVNAISGFAIGGVAPLGFLGPPPPTVIDASLKRFTTLYAAAGHPNCVFATTAKNLGKMTKGTFSYALAMV